MNGYIERGDLQTVADRLCDRLVSATKTTERTMIQEAYAELWRFLTTHADADADGRVSAEEYVDAIDVLNNPLHFDATMGRIATALFHALDTDDSGYLQLDLDSLLCKLIASYLNGGGAG